MKAPACPPEIADLVARAVVRRAAIGLARALMREGGVRLRDLADGSLEVQAPRPSQKAGRQLVTRRKLQIYEALRPAGAVGLSLQAVMTLMGKDLKSTHSRMAYYEKIGTVWRRRHSDGALHYVLTDACAPIDRERVHKGDPPPRQTKGLPGVPEAMRPKLPPRPPAKPRKGPKLMAPVERPLDRAIRLSGACAGERKTPPPIEPVKAVPQKLSAQAEVVIPAHVKVQRCQSLNHDPRYQIDPTTFTGGELTAEWDAKRGGKRK